MCIKTIDSFIHSLIHSIYDLLLMDEAGSKILPAGNAGFLSGHSQTGWLLIAQTKGKGQHSQIFHICPLMARISHQCWEP